MTSPPLAGEVELKVSFTLTFPHPWPLPRELRREVLETGRLSFLNEAKNSHLNNNLQQRDSSTEVSE